jgi:hypothetical protein
LARRWPGAKLTREVPVVATLGDQLVHGRIDLLAETSSGFAIIDHKSFPGAPDLWSERALQYAPQLALYGEAVEAVTGRLCDELFVHMPIVGALLRLAREARTNLFRFGWRPCGHMIEVYQNLFVGSQNDEVAIRGLSGWFVIHACKEPYHRQALGNTSIGKFPSVADDRAVTKGEVLALRLAAAAGIDAAEGRLVESEGSSVALIRRFDRLQGGGRLMYVSAATMLGIDVAESGEHAYTEIVDALRMYGAAPQADAEELWRRIAFSILITNVDDHLRNHGFLHVDRGQWRLAPAFDVNPFPDRVRELKTWVSEDVGPEATIEALMSALPYFRIAVPRARQMLREVEHVVSQWRSMGRSLRMSTQELDQFAEAFEHEERAAARTASQ